jgi:hypothetical protein
VVLSRRLLYLIYLVIGLVVASTHHYLSNLDTIRRFLSAILAILLWPLILLGIDLHIKR